MEVKLLLLVLFLGVSSEGLDGDISQMNLPPIDPEVQDHVAKIISLLILKRAQEIGPLIDSQSVLSPPEINIPIDLPDLDLENEIFLNDTHLSSPEGGGSSGLIYGDLHICDPILSGLSSASHSLEINNITLLPIGARLKYSLTGSSGVNGTHSIGVVILMGLLRIESFGFFELFVEKGFLDVELEIGVNSDAFFEVKSTAFDIGFQNVTVHADEAVWNGVEINWPALSAEIVDTFNALWPALGRIVNYVLSPIVSRLLNAYVSNCGIHHILQIVQGNLTCLGLPEPSIFTNDFILAEVQQLIPFDFGRDENSESCDVKYTIPPLPATTTQPTTEGSDESPSGAMALGPFSVLGFFPAALLLNSILH